MSTRTLFKLYQQTLNRRPYLVQAVQTAALMGAGDFISQTLIEKQRFVDYTRTLKFAAIGFCYIGPVVRVWYGVLDKHLGSGGKLVGVKKVFCDQALFAPCFLSTILVLIPTMQGKNWDLIKKDLYANYFDVLTTNYCVWPWVQIINFSYVPLQYQVLVAQVVALFWNTYLAWKTNKNELSDTEYINNSSHLSRNKPREVVGP